MTRQRFTLAALTGLLCIAWTLLPPDGYTGEARAAGRGAGGPGGRAARQAVDRPASQPASRAARQGGARVANRQTAGQAPAPTGNRGQRAVDADHDDDAEAASQPLPGGGDPFAVRVMFGVGDAKAVDWSGKAAPGAAKIEAIQPYRFQGEVLNARKEWRLKSRGDQADQKANNPGPPGLDFVGRSIVGRTIRFQTQQGDFELDPLELPLGKSVERLDGRVRATRIPYARNLSDDYEESDFPAIATGPDGQVWAVWASYIGGRDEIRLAAYDAQRQAWNTFSRLPNTSNDVWMPQLVFDGKSRLWVVWGQQFDGEGNFDLYARPFANNAWGAVERLTDSPYPDINHHVAADGDGGFYVVWQAWRGRSSDIFLAHHGDKGFGETVNVSARPENDWNPSVAARDGRAWVAYDSYRDGSYNVYLRPVKKDKPGDELVVADTPFYEANASVACARDGRVFVAYDEGPVNWTKDQGLTIRDREPGSAMYTERDVKLLCLKDGKWKAPAQPVSACLPAKSDIHFASLHMDGDQRLWVRFRARFQLSSLQDANRGAKAGWEEKATYWDGDGWAPAIAMPHSNGRLGMIARASADQNGLWAVWPTDNRDEVVNVNVPFHQDVWAARLQAGGASGKMEFVDAAPTPLKEGQRVWDWEKEARDVAAIRGYATTIDGAPHAIYRGDLHRHTELSWDVGGRRDGTIYEFYRYMLDSADMDFGAITDHQGGGEREYNWWLTQKTSDLYHAPGEFTPFYAYERSAVYPNGHRNVVLPERGNPVVHFFTKESYAGERPGIGTGALVENDTKLLFETLRRTGGVSIPHTSATGMGTDWRDNDPQIEPVVEIFQGARNSYEYEGAPRAAKTEAQGGKPAGGYQPAGFVWNAWNKGYRLGVIASSDHVSTHISYAMVYSPDASREGILEAIRKRQTYGATDNIILDVRCDGHFMGSEFTTSRKPTLQVKVIGTGDVARVDIVKDEKIVYQLEPGTREVEFTFTDADIDKGLHYYYARVLQKDEEIAWGSPIWVNYKK